MPIIEGRREPPQSERSVAVAKTVAKTGDSCIEQCPLCRKTEPGTPALTVDTLIVAMGIGGRVVDKAGLKLAGGVLPRSMKGDATDRWWSTTGPATAQREGEKRRDVAVPIHPASWYR